MTTMINHILTQVCYFQVWTARAHLQNAATRPFRLLLGIEFHGTLGKTTQISLDVGRKFYASGTYSRVQ